MRDRRWQLAVAGLAIFTAAFLFARWLKFEQLVRVSPALPAVYPLLFRAETTLFVLLVFLLTLALWLTCALFLLRFTERGRFALLSSFAYLALALAPASRRLAFRGFYLYLIGLSVYWIVRKRHRFAWRAAMPHLSVLLLTTLTHVFRNHFASPLSWSNPLVNYPYGSGGFVPVSSSVFKSQYVNAKLFSFFGLDHAFWGAILRSANGLYSWLIPFLSFTLDLPAVDTDTYHRLLLIITFASCVLGSFGFYLYLYRGLRLSFAVSAIGGVLFVFYNQYFAFMMASDYPAFYTVFVCFPFSLLFLHLAFDEGEALWAGASGIALALPFYLIAPHPEAVMHGVWVYLAYLLFLILGGPQTLVVGIRLAAVSLVAYFFAAAAYLWPLFHMVRAGEVIYFGHKQGAFNHSFHGPVDLLSSSLEGLWPWVVCALALLPVLAVDRQRHRIGLFFFAVLLWFLLFFVPGESGWLASFLEIHFPTINFFTFYRFATYYAWALLVLALYGLEALRTARLRPALLGLAGVVAVGGLLYLLRPSLYSALEFFGAFFEDDNWSRPALATSLLALAIAVGLVVRDRLPRRARPALTALLVAAAIGMAALSRTVGFFQPVVDPQNPRDCRPYTLLATVLANYPGVAPDPSSLDALRQRFLDFERDVREPVDLRGTETARAYQALLGLARYQSASELVREELLPAAIKLAPFLDHFYTNEYGCIYRPGFPKNYRVPDPNRAALLQSVGRNQRVLFATGDETAIGIGQGFLMHNAAESIDSRYMASFPPIHELYLMPGNYYQELGTSVAPMQWIPKLVRVLNSAPRRIHNLAGIDYYVAHQKDWDGAPLQAKEDVVALPQRLPLGSERDFVLLRDQRSNGLAFLAERIHHADPSLAQFDQFKAYFSAFDNRAEWPAYRAEADEKMRVLAKLSRHEALLTDGAAPSEAGGSGNRVIVEQVIDNRAALRVHCEQQPCLLVFNFAAIDGWRAFAEEQELPIERVNLAFLGTRVPLGDHLIWFENRSVPVRAGLLASLLTLVAGLWWGLQRRWQR